MIGHINNNRVWLNLANLINVNDIDVNGIEKRMQERK